MPDPVTQVGFCASAQPSIARFHFYAAPGDSLLHLLTFAQTRACAAAVLGRIYYRDEVLSHLKELDPALLDEVRRTDAALGLAAYLGGGADALAELEGDFAMVVWDGERQHLIGLRDPMGGYPLFWAQQGGRVAMSPCLRPLADLLPGIEVDPQYLAQFLMLPACSFEEITTQTCAIAGIHRVLPGDMVTANMKTQAIERRTVFDWPERIVRQQETAARMIKTPADAGQAYLQRVRDAVRQRMRGAVAAHLSGGMDSTTVALLAAQLAGEGHGDGPVHAYSLIYSEMGVLARETSRVRSVQQAPNLVPHDLEGDRILDFDGFSQPPLHDEPWPWLPRIAMNSILTVPASNLGARTVMSGLGADEVLDLPPVHIGDLMRRGRFIAAWREASRWAQAQPCSRWTMLFPYGLKALVPACAQDGLGTLLRGGRASAKHISATAIPPWIAPAFARQHHLRRIGLAHFRRINRGVFPTSLAMSLAAVHSRRGELTRRYISLPRGAHEAHPFLDPRVTCFAMALRPEVKFIPGGRKIVLAEATRGILPEDIRTRQRKGHFNEVYFMGLSRHLPELEDLVQQAPVDDLAFLDRTPLIECLQRAALGGGIAGGAMDRLNLVLSLLKWLSMLPAWKQAAWTPLRSVEVADARMSPARA